MKIARVVWHDIYVREEWHASLKYKPYIMESIGYVRVNQKRVTVIPNLCPKQKGCKKEYFGVVHIPRGCVESIEYLQGMGRMLT